jgi:hypothetical protein
MKNHHWLLTEKFPFCLTSTTIITHRYHVVPWFPFDPIGGFLVFVNNIHYWILFREYFSCAIPSGACRIRTSVWSLQSFCSSPSKYLAFYYSSCWMMEDALIPSFQWISSYWLQHIFALGHGSRVVFSTLWLAVISGRFCLPHRLFSHITCAVYSSSFYALCTMSIHYTVSLLCYSATALSYFFTHKSPSPTTTTTNSYSNRNNPLLFSVLCIYSFYAPCACNVRNASAC